jgi:hypothetical protein
MKTTAQGGGSLLSEAGVQALSRSAVCRRVPVRIQSKLNRAIMLRSSSRASIDALAAKYDLPKQYGVSAAALRSYARRLEELLRPVLASQLVAAALGCMPEAYRRQALAGSQVLLLSRFVGCVWQGDAALSAAEMAKLAAVLGSFAEKGASKTARSGRPATPDGTPSSNGQPTKLAEAVRAVYGLTWPPTSRESEKASQAQQEPPKVTRA